MLREEKVSATRGSEAIARTCSVSRAVMNQSSALGSTSWRAMGRLRGPSGPNVVIIAMGRSSSRSASFFWSVVSVMAGRTRSWMTDTRGRV